MRRLAVIDVGSNTVKLVDYAYEPHRSFREVDELRAVVRLSEGVGSSGRLGAAPFERGIATLGTFASYCRAVRVRDVVAVATSAVRAATNGERFVRAARERTGLRLRVLGGEEEARLGALAAANAFADDDAVVLDLGGGSLQLSRLASRRVVDGASWPLGAVWATESYLRGDPPTCASVRALAAAVRAAVGPWLERAGAEPVLIGMGGTLRNLAKVDQARRGYPIDLLHGYRITAEALATLAEELLSRDASSRADLPGLARDRADIIAAGAVVVGEVLAASGASAVTVSGQGLREGLLHHYLVPDGDHLLPDVRDFAIRNLMRHHHDRPRHNEHVRALAWRLFDGTAPLHGLGAEARDLLGAAALVHDIGMAVDYYRHEHHGFMLTMGRPLPGFSHREQAIVALLVRHHRKGRVDDAGLGSVLEPGDLEAVGVLSGLLRVSEYLDRGKAQRVSDVAVDLGDGVVRIRIVADGDADLEVEAARLRADLLADALGVRIEVDGGAARDAAGTRARVRP